jgi:hypothetical protein
MNEDPIDRLLARDRARDLPGAPANLESRVLRSIRTTPAEAAAFPAFFSWRLEAAVVGMALATGWVAAFAVVTLSETGSPDRARLALSLEAFDPSMIDLTQAIHQR